MIEMAASESTGYLINCDREQMLVIRDGIDHALEHGEWEAACFGEIGVVPMRIRVSDEPVFRN